MEDALLRKKSRFYPSVKLLKGDYDLLIRDENNEPYIALSYHDFYECQVFLSKTGIINVNGDEYLIQGGDLLFIDMFTPHQLLINPEAHYERFSISVSPSLLIAMSTPNTNLLELFRYSDSHPPVVHLTPDKFQKYRDLVAYYRNIHLKNAQDVFDEAIIDQCFAFAYDDCHVGGTVDPAHMHYVSIVSELIRYINQNLDSDLSLPVLANQVNYSVYYVCRIFRRMTGKNLSAYIQEKRIGEAARMLREGSPIAKAAEAVGFNNYSYFYKTFLRIVGQAPNSYRKACLEAAREKE